MRRALARRRRQQLGQGRDVRQRAPIEDAMPSGPHTVMRDGVTADAEVPGDPAIRLAQVQPAENLTDVGHRTPPSRHSSPPGVGVLSRRFRVAVRTRKESGHDPPGGGSLWPTLGGSVWVTLPGSRWATPGGSASPTPVAQYRVAADKSRSRPSGRPRTGPLGTVRGAPWTRLSALYGNWVTSRAARSNSIIVTRRGRSNHSRPSRRTSFNVRWTSSSRPGGPRQPWPPSARRTLSPWSSELSAIPSALASSRASRSPAVTSLAFRRWRWDWKASGWDL